jgi:uncharacterized tellurite resistance protein B-like protein
MSLFEKLGFGGAGKSSGEDQADTKTVRKIVRKLEALEPDRARYIAAFAYVMVRVANADRIITDDEVAAMEHTVTKYGKLSEDLAVLVVEIARMQNLLFGGTEDYLVTRELARIATREQKRDLLNCLFAVAAADGSISVVEENEISQIHSALRIPRSDLIAAKEPFADVLETIQKGPTGER